MIKFAISELENICQDIKNDFCNLDFKLYDSIYQLLNILLLCVYKTNRFQKLQDHDSIIQMLLIKISNHILNQKRIERCFAEL